MSDTANIDEKLHISSLISEHTVLKIKLILDIYWQMLWYTRLKRNNSLTTISKMKQETRKKVGYGKGTRHSF